MGRAPSGIFLDAKCILSFIFKTWIKDSGIIIIDSSSKPDFKTIIQDENIKCENIKVLDFFIESLCQLHIEQYYLVFKAIKKFQESILIADDEINLAIILLISSIEAASEKYSDIKVDFNDTNYGQFIKRLLFKTMKSRLDPILRQELYNKIGEGFMKTQFNRIQAKMKDFMLNFYTTEFPNEKTEQMLNDLLYMRNKYLHGGVRFEIQNKETPFKFNIYNKFGKPQFFQDNKGKHIRVARLPSFNHLLEFFHKIIMNFVDFLYKRRDDPKDIELYKSDDFNLRGDLRVSVKKKNRTSKGRFLFL